MIIYFVRHGHPNYEIDRLTEVGHRQAAAVAKRLATLDIRKIYSSTLGRAMDTARHTADLLNQEIVPCDFMRELTWDSLDGSLLLEGGDPGMAGQALIRQNENVMHPNWYLHEPYCRSVLPTEVKRVTDGCDRWLADLGYERSGDFYRVTKEHTDYAVAMFSHGWASSAVLARMFNLSFTQVCAMYVMGFTSVTRVVLPDQYGGVVYPCIEYFNDCSHIRELPC